MVPFLILLLIGVAAGQLGFGTDVARGGGVNMPQITKLDVQCAKTGMTVNLEFSAPFNGVVFSKGFYSNPQCRYVRSNGRRGSYSFTIPMSGCGTRVSNSGPTAFDNTIIIQMDELIQEIWDTARKITCEWQDTIEKTVTFRPFVVGMLDVVEVTVRPDEAAITSWMGIQRGKGPFGPPLEGIIKIGDELTVVIYASAGGATDLDIKVSNCYAYSSRNYNARGTRRIRLLDDRGCLLHPKLMNYFFRTTDTRSTGADIIAFASISAFKFPDQMDVFLTCEVELCKGGCEGGCQEVGYPSQVIENFALLPQALTTAAPKTTTEEEDNRAKLGQEQVPVVFPTDPPTTTTRATTPRATTLKRPTGSRFHAFHQFQREKPKGNRRGAFGQRVKRELPEGARNISLHMGGRYQVIAIQDLDFDPVKEFGGEYAAERTDQVCLASTAFTGGVIMLGSICLISLGFSFMFYMKFKTLKYTK